jgi:methylenetetrahydrofolate dehydrogenase (NADP+)/methenyltetrahydrofolate cyclohydrolase
MQTRLIDGSGIAREVRIALKSRVDALRAAGRPPGLAVVIAGDDPASRIYVRNKIKACEEVGIRSTHIEIAADADEIEVLAHIDRLNRDPAVHGILVQLPLPPQVSAERVLEAVSPDKDVDGFHPENLGLLVIGRPRFSPCTPAGVMKILEHEGIDPQGKHAVVIGRSNIVGKPMALLLLNRGATVSVCHSKTSDLQSLSRDADILVVATGRPNLVDGSMVKPGAIVIDVGINRLPSGKLSGDVHAESVLGTAALLTPVPGGVGPMTIAMLLSNTVQAAERSAPQ